MKKHVGTTLITESILIQYLLFFLVKGSNSATMDAPISYFTNPSYPETDWVPNYNTYTIKVRNTYRIHLEYIYNMLYVLL